MIVKGKEWYTEPKHTHTHTICTTHTHTHTHTVHALTHLLTHSLTFTQEFTSYVAFQKIIHQITGSLNELH